MTTLVDSTPFYGAKVPPELKTMIKNLEQLDKQLFRAFLKAVVLSFGRTSLANASAYNNLCKKLEKDEAAILYGGLLSMITMAMRTYKLKEETMKLDLKLAKVPDDVVDDIVSAVFGSKRGEIMNSMEDAKPSHDKLSGLRWRVDVAVSSSHIRRIFEPVAVLELEIGGDKRMVEAPVHKFQELRYTVAQLLRDMNDLESRAVLKFDS